jgi:riboflavin kinase / FMN adenylyltransferase
MLVHRNLEKLPAFKNAVITIGTFDGVHKGHQQILQQLNFTASACLGESVIITFEPHPREVLTRKDQGIKLLNTLDEKIRLLYRQQIDHLVIIPFTVEFSKLSAEEYIKDFLLKYFHPHTIIIGYDHRFGHNREGNIHLLKKFESVYGYEVQEIPPQLIQDIAVSSTRIRNSLQEGNITLANELLGYDYTLEGKVIHGDQLGRKLGYPTANIEPIDVKKLIPAIGVYAVTLHIKNDAKRYKGMLNIGYRPTFNGKEFRIEVNIFDFNKEIYNQEVTLHFKAFIRPDQRFENAAGLTEQLAKDKMKAMSLL